ncbi:uncharacterized protein LOC114532792 isoform X2 [Dendronephthya gigantea]|uniref:uncharacterized protein LOC114532792 isoform X2 n=1 Tax=Dendronephthya gigantea TaxID=151771 RepID=UPI00106CD864|nr:uncharacterized protein LOC114532792 isoform X2 [Dendronephthya gigantea]
MKAGYQVIHAYTANYIPRRVSCQKHIQCARYVNPYRRSYPRSRKLKMDNDSCESPAPENFTVPIVGYEIVEKRQRFTLMTSFPRIKLHLPPKRRLGDNFNPEFIARRAQGLQNFIRTILQHRNLRMSRETREFFCLDEPPGPFDSLEESRAYVQFLEEQMENTKSVVMELNSQLEATKSQLSEARAQIKSLEWSLRHRPFSDPGHSTPAANCGELRHTLDTQLSDISDPCSSSKTRKNVSFAQTKSFSEGNLLQLKRQRQTNFPTLKDGSGFRHSITFGEDSFLYNGFLDLEFHSNVTRKMKERKRKARGKKQRHEASTHEIENVDKLSRTRKRAEHKREKRDSGIIGDGCTDSD